MQSSRLVMYFVVLIGLLAGVPKSAHAHGDVQPQPVDTTGLDPLKEGEWLTLNPYSGNATAIKIGTSGCTCPSDRTEGDGAWLEATSRH